MSPTLASTAATSPALAPGKASKHKSLFTVRTRVVFFFYSEERRPRRPLSVCLGAATGLRWARPRPSALCWSPSRICEGICKPTINLYMTRAALHKAEVICKRWSSASLASGPPPSTINDEPWPKSRRTARVYSMKIWCIENIAA